MTEHAFVRLPPEPTSARLARQFVRSRCLAADIRADSCADAELLTSELVTNAVLYGRSEVCLELDLDGSLLRISVADENSRVPAVAAEDADALAGRGLVLVREVARSWGVQRRGTGKAVWFDVLLR